MFNPTFKDRIRDRHGFLSEPVGRTEGLSDPAVIAEFAFFLARIATEGNITVAEAFQHEKTRSIALHKSIAAVGGYEEHEKCAPLQVTTTEQMEAFELARNYEHFFIQRFRSEKILFSPWIPGAGFIDSCRADISIGNYLFEVKTVTRKIASKDIRQLVTYLALQSATGERRWNKAGFLNPRKAEYHEFEVDELIAQISGGRSSAEVFQELLAFASAREIQLDTAF